MGEGSYCRKQPANLPASGWLELSGVSNARCPPCFECFVPVYATAPAAWSSTMGTQWEHFRPSVLLQSQSVPAGYSQEAGKTGSFVQADGSLSQLHIKFVSTPLIAQEPLTSGRQQMWVFHQRKCCKQVADLSLSSTSIVVLQCTRKTSTPTFKYL